MAVVAKENKFEVQTFLDGALKDKQVVATIPELISNDWVDFTGAGAPVANAGTKLTGGENGTVTAEVLTSYFAAAEKVKWNTMGVPLTLENIGAQVTSFIKRMRDDLGKNVRPCWWITITPITKALFLFLRAIKRLLKKSRNMYLPPLLRV